jgi:hypothetical protein
MKRNRMLLAVAVGNVLAVCYTVAPPLALVTVAALLFAVLLYRSGLSRAVVVGIVALHILLLGLVVPLSAPLAGFTCFASGTCAYAVLVVRRLPVRLVILSVTHVLFIALCAQASPQVAVVFGGALAMLTRLFFAVGR